MKSNVLAVLWLITLGLAVPAGAQTGAPCDASVPVKGCRAEIRLDGKFIVLKSDTPRCSVIDWTLDGSPRSTTVLDGMERIELLTTRPKELTIENCTEVKDLRRPVQGARPAQPDRQCASHILVATDSEARKLISQLQRGADFEQLARAHTQDPSGVVLGCYASGTMVPEFERAVSELEPGEIARNPVQTEFGYHVVRRD